MGAVQEVIARAWPYDGPHTPDSVTSAAHTIDDLARYLANATRGAKAVDMGTVYSVDGALSSAAAGLGQVLGQVAGRVELLPGLFAEEGYDVGDQVAAHAAALQRAQDAAGVLCRALADAHNAAGRLGQDVPE